MRKMNGIYARLDLKPDYPSADARLAEWKKAHKGLFKKEFEEMKTAKTYEANVSDFSRERRRKMSRKRRWLFFLKDMDFFIDFCIARFLVWRTHR
jgi:hypothetical protein